MPKTIACLHAHHSNIEVIEKMLSSHQAELIHFVEPGFDRQKADAHFKPEFIQSKLANTMRWISSCHVDAILVTCTFFTAHLPLMDFSVPIIKIDELLFSQLKAEKKPAILAFTNPQTVDGTMQALAKFDSSIEAKSHLLPNTFHLIMNGKKREYLDAVSQGLAALTKAYPDHVIYAAQLSMADAAVIAREIDGGEVGHYGELVGERLEIINLD